MNQSAQLFNATFVSTVIYLDKNQVATNLMNGGAEISAIRESLRKHFSVAMRHAGVPVQPKFVAEVTDWVESEICELQQNRLAGRIGMVHGETEPLSVNT